MRRVLAMSLALAAGAVPAIAGGGYITDARSLESSYIYSAPTGPKTGGDGHAQVDFLPLNRTIEVAAPAGEPLVVARAAQMSEYLGLSVSAEGTAFVNSFVPPDVSATLSARSIFGTTFLLSGPYDYLLQIEFDATLDIFADTFAAGAAAVSLVGPGGTVIDESLTNMDGAIGGPVSLTLAGTLATPGQYTLTAEAYQDLNVTVGNTLGQGSSSFDIDFELFPVPEPSGLLSLLTGGVLFSLLRRRT